jgi:DNA-directed RNA polymerase specialized sigma24 family protein
MAIDSPSRRETLLALRALCLDQSISRKRREGLRRLADEAGEAPSGTLREVALDPLVRTELRNEVKGALRRLSRGEVEALTLVHDGHDAEEISRIFSALGRPKSVPEVRALITRARLRYRHALEDALRSRKNR